MMKSAYLTLLALVVTGLAVPALAQQPQATPAFKNRAEYDGYNAAYLEKDPAKKAGLAAKFFTDFPAADISFRTNAYEMMVKGYLESQNYPKTMETATKIDEALPNTPPGRKAILYSYGMSAAQGANDIQKVIEFGDNVLAIQPTEANTLITLAGLIPERLPADEAGKKAALEKAEGYSNRALAEVAKIFGGAKPAGMTDADWNNQRTTATAGLHANLGFIALNRMEYNKAVAEYEQVVKATPKDAIALFRIGLAYSSQAAAVTKTYVASVDAQNAAIKENPADKAKSDELKAVSDGLEQALRAKRTQATDALATAVAIGGPVEQPATDQLKKLWTGTPEELAELIKSKKPQ